MNSRLCEFCGRPYDPSSDDPSGRHGCCGIRSAGERTGRIEATCRILGEIGGGSTGTVYLAEQLRLHRKAALKIMSPSGLADVQTGKLFLSEIRAGGKLIHPHIVRIYTAGETDAGVPYAIMEYIDGETLESVLARRHTLPEPEVRRIAAQIADALEYAWRTARIAHGDLKPANIMIRRSDGSVCIFDLGLQAARQENNIRAAMGTPLYAAPELINDAFGGNDFRADIYSLGIMLYELTTGHAPFEGTPEEIIRAHLDQDPPPLRQQVPEVSAELAGLAAQMISRYAPERPDWAEVLRVLRHSDKDAPDQPTLVAPPRSATALRMLTLFVLGIALSGMIGYTLAPRRPATTAALMARSHADQAFRLAAEGRADELRKLLRSGGFPVDTENDRGNTLLMQAVIFNRAEVVRMLLNDFDPDLNHRNKLGETVYDLAQDSPALRKFLRRPGPSRPKTEK